MWERRRERGWYCVQSICHELRAFCFFVSCTGLLFIFLTNALCICHLRLGLFAIQPEGPRPSVKEPYFFCVKSDAQVHGHLCTELASWLRVTYRPSPPFSNSSKRKGGKGKEKHVVCLRTFPRNCVCPFCVHLVTCAQSLTARKPGKHSFVARKMTWQN